MNLELTTEDEIRLSIKNKDGGVSEYILWDWKDDYITLKSIGENLIIAPQGTDRIRIRQTRRIKR